MTDTIRKELLWPMTNTHLIMVSFYQKSKWNCNIDLQCKCEWILLTCKKSWMNLMQILPVNEPSLCPITCLWTIAVLNITFLWTISVTISRPWTSSVISAHRTLRPSFVNFPRTRAANLFRSWTKQSKQPQRIINKELYWQTLSPSHLKVVPTVLLKIKF